MTFRVNIASSECIKWIYTSIYIFISEIAMSCQTYTTLLRMIQEKNGQLVKLTLQNITIRMSCTEAANVNYEFSHATDRHRQGPWASPMGQARPSAYRQGAGPSLS